MVDYEVQNKEGGFIETAKNMPTYPRMNEVLFDGDNYQRVLIVIHPITYMDSEGRRLDGIAPDGLVKIIVEQLPERKPLF